MRKLQRPLAVFLVSLIFFLVDFDQPTRTVFDEAHYLPAAHSIWDLEPNNNYEHPPLAKEIMGLSMWITGMDLNGARIASILFGALACVAFYLLSCLILEDEDWAILALVLAWVNGLTFVISRLAMLEIFLSSFMLWAAYFFMLALNTKRTRDYVLSAVCIGAAIACKWYALIPWVYLSAASVYFTSGRRWKTVLIFTFVPLAIYALTYVPLMLVDGPQYGPWALVQMQAAMYSAQKMFVAQHAEFSMWSTWPLKLRPMWLMRDVTDTGGKLDVEAVILLGNPLVLWFGLGSLAYMLTEVHKRAESALAPVYLALFLPWVLIPRVNTFYYYYFPLAWIVTLGATDALKRLWESEALIARVSVRVWVFAAAGFFFYHWPLYSAWRMSMDSAQRWYPHLF